MTTLPTIPDATRKLTAAERRSEMAWIRGLVEDAKQRAGMPEISFKTEWNNRFTRRLGDARPTHRTGGVLRFSATALYLRATAKEREDLVYHEAAHVLANLKHNRQCGHGPLWRSMMRTLGRTPDRCHKVNRDGLHRKGSKRWALEQMLKKRPDLAGVLKAVERKEPVPVLKPGVPTTVRVRPNMVGNLVAWDTERGQAVGRVVKDTRDGYEILVVGDHLRKLHGRLVTVGAAACRPY